MIQIDCSTVYTRKCFHPIDDSTILRAIIAFTNDLWWQLFTLIQYFMFSYRCYKCDRINFLYEKKKKENYECDLHLFFFWAVRKWTKFGEFSFLQCNCYVGNFHHFCICFYTCLLENVNKFEYKISKFNVQLPWAKVKYHYYYYCNQNTFHSLCCVE